ncbi:MAG TPA: hypothetical protein PLC89_27200 [Haliscomenobacter sp.]|uniref:hypothetical protein n=1 Tax=Haliscomenobacter sp. TaxID=2717303 RepID=UPI002D000FAF|nr:hypothetical protein [Haliscomenobacter sp.]HOY21029.1 hypothetical protein [Haliscomenobacter sp.]
MSQKKKSLLGCLPYLLIGALLSWGVYECNYRFSYWQDLQARPWAYSKDKNAKLLVGQWHGSFSDPDGIAKSISLEIFAPLSDAERRKKASGRHRRRTRGGLGSRKDKRLFEGIATVSSRLGQEEYTLYGSVDEADYHQLQQITFGAVDEKKRIKPNFALNLSESGQWTEDEMTLRLGFAYFQVDGSSFSSSADPRFDHIASVVLKRQ